MTERQIQLSEAFCWEKTTYFGISSLKNPEQSVCIAISALTCNSQESFLGRTCFNSAMMWRRWWSAAGGTIPSGTGSTVILAAVEGERGGQGGISPFPPLSLKGDYMQSIHTHSGSWTLDLFPWSSLHFFSNS